MTEPTDAELLAEWDRVSHIADAGQRRLACLRAVLAKWGTPPAVAGQPVAWYEYNADLDAWFLAYSNNPNPKAKTRPLVFGDTTPQPTQAQAGAVPLTKAELTKRAKVGPIHTERGDKVVLFLATYRNELENRFTTGWREAERYHGIKGGQHER